MIIKQFLEECDKYDRDTKTKLVFRDTFYCREERLGVIYSIEDSGDYGMTVGELKDIVQHSLTRSYTYYDREGFRVGLYRDIVLSKDYKTVSGIMCNTILELSIISNSK